MCSNSLKPAEALALAKQVGNQEVLELQLISGNSLLETDDWLPIWLQVALNDRAPMAMFRGRLGTRSNPVKQLGPLGAMLTPEVIACLEESENSTLRGSLWRVIRYAPEITIGVTGTDLRKHVPESVTHSLNNLLETEVSALSKQLFYWSPFIEAVRQSWGDTWSIDRLAVFVALKVKEARSETVGLLRNEIPLLDRLGFAKTVTSVDWWKEQLRSADESENLRDKKFVALAVFTCLPTNSLMKLADCMQSYIDELPEESWRLVVDAMNNYRRLFNKQRGRPTPPFQSSWPQSISPRFASALLYRSRSSTAEAIRSRYLPDYDGDDATVHRAAIEIVQERLRENGRDWNKALPVIARGYAHGVTASWGGIVVTNSWGGIDVTDKLSLSVAETICSDAPSYPLELVAMAEGILAQHTGSLSKPVGMIASDEGWFADDTEADAGSIW